MVVVLERHLIGRLIVDILMPAGRRVATFVHLAHTNLVVLVISDVKECHVRSLALYGLDLLGDVEVPVNAILDEVLGDRRAVSETLLPSHLQLISKR